MTMRKGKVFLKNTKQTEQGRQSLIVVSLLLLLRFPQEPGRYIFILYLEAGETELINTYVVPFTIAEFGQKCLDRSSIHTKI